MAATSISASSLVAPLASAARVTSARASRGCQLRSNRPSAFLGNAGSVLLGSKKGLSSLLSVPCAQSKAASPAQNRRMTTVAMAGKGLPIDLTGKKAFIAGVADDQGFGWAIAKAMAEAGATIILGTWVPALNIFETSFRKGKFDDSRQLADGSMLDFAKIYPMDAVFDTPEDVPEEVKTNKRYAGAGAFTVQEVADQVKKDFGNIDIIVHSLANGPEVAKPLLETSRKGYLAANSASSYSFVSMVQRFGPIMNPGGAAVALTYLAGERVVPGYGGGMSSAKASLDSDIKVLAYEAGRKWNIRVNAVSAGPLASRAAKAIGFIDVMIRYSAANAPLTKNLYAEDVGATATFLCSPLAKSITAEIVHCDNGLNVMAVSTDSPILNEAKSA